MSTWASPFFSTQRPKYPVFYKVGPLVENAFDDVELPNLGMGDLVDRLILQLRLTTLARSGDLQRVVWGLFQQDGQFFLRFTDKNAALQTASVQPVTVATIRKYMSRHLYHPGEFSIRGVSEPSRPMAAHCEAHARGDGGIGHWHTNLQSPLPPGCRRDRHDGTRGI
jgi:hypothetical protein